MIQKPVVLLAREHQSMEITEDVVLTRISDGIEIVYQYGEGDDKIIFTSSDRARVGDRIVQSAGRWILVRKEQFEQRFVDLPEELDIRTSEKNDRVTAYLTGKKQITGRMIIEIRKIDGAWIISRNACDISDYDMVSALTILQVFDAAVRKVKEIDPTGWFEV